MHQSCDVIDHAQMYALGAKYEMQALKNHALRKFKAMLSHTPIELTTAMFVYTLHRKMIAFSETWCNDSARETSSRLWSDWTGENSRTNART